MAASPSSARASLGLFYDAGHERAMPGMSGLAFGRQIRLQPKLAKVPVVILSASGGKPRTLRLRSGQVWPRRSTFGDH